jgi:hypothetical protein
MSGKILPLTLGVSPAGVAPRDQPSPWHNMPDGLPQALMALSRALDGEPDTETIFGVQLLLETVAAIGKTDFHPLAKEG